MTADPVGGRRNGRRGAADDLGADLRRLLDDEDELPTSARVVNPVPGPEQPPATDGPQRGRTLPAVADDAVTRGSTGAIDRAIDRAVDRAGAQPGAGRAGPRREDAREVAAVPVPWPAAGWWTSTAFLEQGARWWAASAGLPALVLADTIAAYRRAVEPWLRPRGRS